MLVNACFQCLMERGGDVLGVVHDDHPLSGPVPTAEGPQIGPLIVHRLGPMWSDVKGEVVRWGRSVVKLFEELDQCGFAGAAISYKHHAQPV